MRAMVGIVVAFHFKVPYDARRRLSRNRAKEHDIFKKKRYLMHTLSNPSLLYSR
jgi:hypothetical protein